MYNEILFFLRINKQYQVRHVTTQLLSDSHKYLHNGSTQQSFLTNTETHSHISLIVSINHIKIWKVFIAVLYLESIFMEKYLPQTCTNKLPTKAPGKKTSHTIITNHEIQSRNLKFSSFSLRKLDKAVTIQTCILEVPDLYLSAHQLSWQNICGFPYCFQVNALK